MPGRPVAIALDTKGPEIRSGNTVDNADVPIAMGAEITITTNEKYKNACDDKTMWEYTLYSVLLLTRSQVC